jgi:hypothetical protein
MGENLTLNEEDRLRVFENMVQTNVFESKEEKVTAGSRKLHNKELRNL